MSKVGDYVFVQTVPVSPHPPRAPLNQEDPQGRMGVTCREASYGTLRAGISSELLSEFAASRWLDSPRNLVLFLWEVRRALRGGLR